MRPSPLREFLHVHDMAEAALFVLDLPRPAHDAVTRPMLSHINVGSGEDVSILDLAQLMVNPRGVLSELE